MSVSPTDEPAGNTQPTSFFSIATGLGADAAVTEDGATDGVFPLDALPPHPPTASTATHALAPTSHLVLSMCGAYADAHDATTTMQQVQAHHHRWLVHTLQTSVVEPFDIVTCDINLAMAETTAHHPRR